MFKICSGTVYRTVGGESSRVHQEAAAAAAAWKDTILLYLKSQYMPKDISNDNKCGLLYNILPDKASHSKDKVTMA